MNTWVEMSSNLLDKIHHWNKIFYSKEKPHKASQKLFLIVNKNLYDILKWLRKKRKIIRNNLRKDNFLKEL